MLYPTTNPKPDSRVSNQETKLISHITSSDGYIGGRVYMIASPIGSFSDITLRALEVMKGVDYIICEDTRQTIKLTRKYNINKRLISLHQHSSEAKLNFVIEELKKGRNIAYLSDGGTPNLSDPGAKLNELAMQNDIKIVPVPGPSPLLALISVAPFACSDFRFIGFFPKKKGREKLAREISTLKYPVFFFESPKRVRKTVSFLKEKTPDKKLLIGRELTKVFEEILVLDLSAITDDNVSRIPEKGEFVLAIFS